MRIHKNKEDQSLTHTRMSEMLLPTADVLFTNVHLDQICRKKIGRDAQFRQVDIGHLSVCIHNIRASGGHVSPGLPHHKNDDMKLLD